MDRTTFPVREMKVILLEKYFLFLSLNFFDIFCGKWPKVVLDYSDSNGNYKEDFEKTIKHHMGEVISEVKKDGKVEVSYEIKPPKNSDHNTDEILLGILDKTISKLAPYLDVTIAAEQTSEYSGNDSIITFIEYQLTFSENKKDKNELILHIDTDDDLSNNTEIVEFVDSLYRDYEKGSQANHSWNFKIGLPPKSTENSVEMVRKNFLNLFWNRKTKLEKYYMTEENFRMNYNPQKELKDIDVTINFITSNKTLNIPKKIDNYDFTFAPIRVVNSTASTKDRIIEELQRHIEENRKTGWWSRHNSVLFTFEIPNYMTSLETNQLVEDLYLDLEDVEPKATIYPAHIRDKNVEIVVELPPIQKMYLNNFNQRFPHVIHDSIPIKRKEDLAELSSRVEEILDFQYFMEKRRDSGQKIYLNLFFDVEGGETEEYYTNLVRRISGYLKTIKDVKFISYEWIHKERNWEILLVKVGVSYSANKAHDGIRAAAEAGGRKRRRWFRWLG